MERLSLPDMLRTCANALENKGQLINVEGIRRRPSLDQDMLLEFDNMATVKRPDYKESLPNVGTVAEKLKERVIEVSTSNNQSVILGLFYTTLYPLKRQYQQVVAGIFPLYPSKVEYVIRPEISPDGFEHGSLLLTQESFSEENPFLIRNSEFPSFLFFRESPFEANHACRLTPQEEKKYWHEDDILPNKMSLEENLIKIALQDKNYFLRKRLFSQKGFAGFINDPSHRSDSRYRKLYAAYRHFILQKNTKSINNRNLAASQDQTMEL
jgi:hypothetical protein